jgi:hypothetical protein
LIKMIHNQHQAPPAPSGTPPKRNTKPGKSKKSTVVDMTNNSDKDSTSRTDLLSPIMTQTPTMKSCALKHSSMIRIA